MFLDLTKTLLDENDEPALRDGRPLTLGDVLIEAHRATFPQDDGQVKFDRRKMRLRIQAAVKADGGRNFELTTKEADTVKQLVGRYALTDISAQVWEFIESVRPPETAAGGAAPAAEQTPKQSGEPGGTA
jgi:hypothetical protein